MKRTALIVSALLGFGLAAGPAFAAGQNDFQTIQKAVRQNPAYEEGREVRWFKVVISDGTSNEAQLKITLPIALIELILSQDSVRHVKLDDDKYGKCEVDLKALWNELKKAGPMALVEISDHGAVIKVWLE